MRPLRYEPKYLALADQLAQAIERGLYAAGDAMPSVRQLMAQNRLSLATVNAALNELKDRGLIYARPRKGNFVANRAKVITPRDASLLQPRPVAIQHTISALNRAKIDSHSVNLAAAVVSPSWVPTALIARAVRRVASMEPVKLAAEIIPAPGLESLRIKICQIMELRGVHVGPDDVVVTNGDAAAMEAALRIVNPQRKAVVIEHPTYFGILQILQRQGLKAIEIATDDQGMNLEDLSVALSENDVGAIIVNPTFHNPCGFNMPTPKKKQLAHMAAQFGVPMIEDDVFGDLYFGRMRPPAVKSFDETGNILHCSSFSKTSTPGWRLGWIVPGQWRDAFVEDQLITSTGVSSLPQLALAELLKGTSYTKHLQSLRLTAAQQAPVIRAEILKHFPKGTQVSSPAGGFLFWINCLGINIEKFCAMANTAGISVAPGIIFSSAGELQHALRLSFGMNTSTQVLRAIAQLGSIASRCQREFVFSTPP